MRVCVTERRDPSPGELLPAGELAPDIALPWVAKLRYGLLAGLASLILLTHYVFGVGLPIAWLAIPLAVMAVSNLLARRVIHLLGARPALRTLLALDTLCLTALLALTGGPANPFTVLYLVIVDLRLANESGLEIVRRLRAADGALAIIMLTGYGEPEELTMRDIPARKTPIGTETRMAILLAALFAFAAAALAQAPEGRIAGVLNDPSGAVVPGGQIEIKALDSGLTTSGVTDGEGRFALDHVAVGRYRASAAFSGFATSVRNDVNVTAGRETVVDFELSIGASTTVVRVTEPAPTVNPESIVQARARTSDTASLLGGALGLDFYDSGSVPHDAAPRKRLPGASPWQMVQRPGVSGRGRQDRCGGRSQRVAYRGLRAAQRALRLSVETV
jgi:CheY-like chemotaxis protein